MFLMIENEGVAPVDGFVVMGVSTARGTDKIGQFGTGNKQAISLLLREGLEPVITCGKDRIEFTTKECMLGDKIYDRIVYKINQKRAVETSLSTDMGAMDWSGVGMALREFISNAIDQNGGQACSIEIKENARAKDGFTRVFVPLSRDIREYFNELSQHFLQFNHEVEEGEKAWPSQGGAPIVYRRGVRVRQLVGTENALFNYNCNNLPIDECRNLDDWRGRVAIGHVIANDENIWVAVMKRVISKEKCWETENITASDFGYGDEPQWGEWWDKHFSSYTIASNRITYEHGQRKGVNVVLVNNGWYTKMHDAGIPAIEDNMASIETAGFKTQDAKPETVEFVRQVWQDVCDWNMDNGQAMPTVKEFTKIMDGGSELMGKMDLQNNILYLSAEHVHSRQTVIEELAHHATKAADGSRDLQDWAFRFLAKIFD